MAAFPEKVTIKLEDIDIFIQALNSIKKDTEELIAFKNAYIQAQEEDYQRARRRQKQGVKERS